MKILVAEDNADFRFGLQHVLKGWGFEVVPVADGVDAWRRLREPDGPRIALLDWLMPGLDGPGVCREVRRRPAGPYIYLILLTGRADQQDIILGLEAGADEYLVKPVDLYELRARLRTGRRIIDLQEQLLAAQEALRHEASHDPLTGLWNRAATLDRLERELARGRREAKAVGALMVDVDHFKRINDTHGHPTGDAVLCELSRRLPGAVRPYDTVGRYGGEEFLVVLPECDAVRTAQLGERLRQAVDATPLDLPDGAIRVTISVGGAATGPPERADAVGLVRAADAALYRAKGGGRNRVEMADGVPGGGGLAQP
jgi:two-component system, cell cycle response regulator